MSIFKKFAVTGVAVLAMSATVLADVEIKPYGAMQYRLRFQNNWVTNQFEEGIPVRDDEGEHLSDEDGNLLYDYRVDEQSPSTFDYSNRLSWRTGLRIKFDDQLSLQFQIGNDWGASENVTWAANNAPRGRVGEQNIYAHLAFARWNPGFMFVEAGIVPLNSNGTLDMFYSRQARGGYEWAGFNGWSDVNSSMIGLKLGAPILNDGFKLGVELFQSVLDARSISLSTSTTEDDVDPDPASEIITVLTVPMQAGDFRITPEATLIFNRERAPAARPNSEGSDLEMLFGASASYKISDAISVNAQGAFGMVDNGGTVAPEWINPRNENDRTRGTDRELTGFFVGAGTSIKAGPGTLQLALNYASSTIDSTTHTYRNFADEGEEPSWAWDSPSVKATTNYLYADIRYAIKLHDRVTFTPRWRLYHYDYPSVASDHVGDLSKSRLDSRVELILDASF